MKNATFRSLFLAVFALAIVGGVHKSTQVSYAQNAGLSSISTETVHRLTLPFVQDARADEPAPVPSLPPLVEPQDPGQVFSWIGVLATIVKAKQWPMLAAVILMLLVYAVRMLVLPVLKVGSDWLALISALMGCAMGVATGLYAGVPVLQALVGGIFVGSAASGLWSLLFKFVLPKPPEAPKV